MVWPFNISWDWERDIKWRLLKIFRPYNSLKLTRLDRGWHEPCDRMEEAICQLAHDYFDGNQPLHEYCGVPYEKSPVSIARQRELLSLAASLGMDALRVADYHLLLGIIEWWQQGGLDVDEMQIWMDVYHREEDNSKAYQIANEAARAVRETVDQNLMTIVRLRGHLWT
jgi:hypothetical protein